MRRKSFLFYSVLAIFVGSALVTLLGLSQVITVKDQHLGWLLTTLIGQVVTAIIALFKGTTFFDKSYESASNAPIVNAPEPTEKKVVTPKVGVPPKKTTQKNEKELLAKFKQWDIVETLEEGITCRELHRIYEFKTFEAAFEFMSQASEKIITTQKHHPRWENTYNRVEIWLTTFNLNRQLSSRDIQQAQSLEELWVELGRGL